MPPCVRVYHHPKSQTKHDYYNFTMSIVNVLCTGHFVYVPCICLNKIKIITGEIYHYCYKLEHSVHSVV